MERIAGTNMLRLGNGEYLIGIGEEIVRGPNIIEEERAFDLGGKTYTVILPIFGDQKITVEGTLEEAVRTGQLP
ncbi:hypothetical protein HYS03_01260 [Candidatus Woesebacteria bacterium]|nr:hypothetical protein [Candidatus Woesebacteria bacterium]